MKTKTDELINDSQRLVGASYFSGYPIKTYDDGFGPLWVSRNSLGFNGIVRARTWEDAYSICEDEFFPEADETIDDFVKEYGFKRTHERVIRSTSSIPEDQRPSYLGAFEKIAEYPADFSDNGKLPENAFLRWVTIETPDPDAWYENELFQEAFGFRNNGANSSDKLKHGIYAKDLNGDSLDRLTPELLAQLEITLQIENEDEGTNDEN